MTNRDSLSFGVELGLLPINLSITKAPNQVLHALFPPYTCIGLYDSDLLQHLCSFISELLQHNLIPFVGVCLTLWADKSPPTIKHFKDICIFILGVTVLVPYFTKLFDIKIITFSIYIKLWNKKNVIRTKKTFTPYVQYRLSFEFRWTMKKFFSHWPFCKPKNHSKLFLTRRAVHRFIFWVDWFFSILVPIGYNLSLKVNLIV